MLQILHSYWIIHVLCVTPCVFGKNLVNFCVEYMVGVITDCFHSNGESLSQELIDVIPDFIWLFIDQPMTSVLDPDKLCMRNCFG